MKNFIKIIFPADLKHLSFGKTKRVNTAETIYSCQPFRLLETLKKKTCSTALFYFYSLITVFTPIFRIISNAAAN